YTQEELENSFKEYIESTTKYMGISKEELLSKIKYWYNGYSWDGKTFAYNPFSTLSFFDKREFGKHWFATGTPTFLIEQIEKIDDLYIELKVVGDDILRGTGSEKIEPTALLFQTGYLTVKKKERGERGVRYTIDFPNFEVREAFLSRLMAVCARKRQEEVERVRDKVYEGLEEKDEKKLERSLTELFANISYRLITERESYYHSLFLLAGKR
ncbi:MAG: AAA family ATPase, partial [Endomicrobium sp.]|nr:AAA family ATPase [Endomicrobium sp.]